MAERAAVGGMDLVLEFAGTQEVFALTGVDQFAELWQHMPADHRLALMCCGLGARSFAKALEGLYAEHLAKLAAAGPLRLRMAVDPAAHNAGNAGWTLTVVPSP